MASMRYTLALTFLCIGLYMLTESEALHGLCSRQWFESCFDLRDECTHAGGKCKIGAGDHAEGCACYDPQGNVLNKSHIPVQSNQRN